MIIQILMSRCMYSSRIQRLVLNAGQKYAVKGYHCQYSAWRQTCLVDRKQLQSFGRDVTKMFPFSMTVPGWSEKISKLLTDFEQSQSRVVKEQRLTFNKLGQIVTEINSLREMLRGYQQSGEYLLRVQGTSQGVLGKLQQFRGKMGTSYEQLAEEEERLNEELGMLDRKIEGMDREQVINDFKENVKSGNREVKVWERRQKQKQKQKIQSSGDKQRGRLQEIDNRMRQKERQVQLLQKGIISLGKNLGWPEQDHTDFVSIWNRGGVKNYFQIEQQLQAYFAFYTGEQIQEHMNKYMKWKKLGEEKRELIVAYKNLKEERKIEELKLLNLERRESKEREEREEMKRRQEKEQAEMKGKIVGWKEAKMRQKKQQQQRRQRQQIQKKRMEAAKRREVQQRNKQLLQQWKQQQSERRSNAELQRAKSARKPTAVDKQAQQRIRLREQILIQKKVQLFNGKRMQQQMARQREQKLREQKFVKFAHVGAKLQQKTVAIKQKQREKFDGRGGKDANTFGGQLLMTGVRGTPSWMKGV